MKFAIKMISIAMVFTLLCPVFALAYKSKQTVSRIERNQSRRDIVKKFKDARLAARGEFADAKKAASRFFGKKKKEAYRIARENKAKAFEEAREARDKALDEI